MSGIPEGRKRNDGGETVWGGFGCSVADCCHDSPFGQLGLPQRANYKERCRPRCAESMIERRVAYITADSMG
jgi:hypothetical protein